MATRACQRRGQRGPEPPGVPAGTPADLDALVTRAPAHRWTLVFPDRHPSAGGPEHRAAYLADVGYEVELVSG